MQAQNIAQLNDRFRKGDPAVLGKSFITAGIVQLLTEQKSPISDLLDLLIAYLDFTEDNDPYDEHDFGAFEFGGKKCFWKIDYFDTEYKMGADDAADLAKTRRVLTIMLAEEW